MTVKTTIMDDDSPMSILLHKPRLGENFVRKWQKEGKILPAYDKNILMHARAVSKWVGFTFHREMWLTFIIRSLDVLFIHRFIMLNVVCNFRDFFTLLYLNSTLISLS